MRVALAQVNPTVGDLVGNAALISSWTDKAKAAGAELVVFPELVISGYPPEDLLLKDYFVADCVSTLHRLAEQIAGIVALVGVPLAEEGRVSNAAAVVAGGGVCGWYRKMCLPNYAVFDEKRYFVPGDVVTLVELHGTRFGLTICEDIWEEHGPGEIAGLGGGASVIVNQSMSPYHLGKGSERETMLASRARAAGAYLCYLNGVGGQDELVFDGHSVVFDPDGRLVARAAQFQEELLVVDLEARSKDRGSPPTARRLEVIVLPADSSGTSSGATDVSGARQGEREEPGTGPHRVCDLLCTEAEVYAALCLGVRDYAGKNGFSHVVMGISGGIDSALTACIAADALGRERVTGVSMPSRYSSSGTKDDAREAAERLGVEFYEIPIESTYGAYLECLAPYLTHSSAGVTEQNIQARIRGNLLMALSNKFGWLVLTTGNKSETAVGYATLYGDMAGGFAVLKDVPKTLVYRLADYRNSLGPGRGPIPASTIARAPSAELAENQTDQDTLPPYDVLDRIIEAYVVRDDSVEEIVALGIDRAVALRVVGMIDGNEYKRRQAAPGVRITPKAFGKDRRLPITNRYRG
jgi:NAD+ synthase (glutamine-hydrolysing)